MTDPLTVVASAASTSPRSLAIETHALVKRYGSKQALAGLDLRVPAGEFFGFLGPNGAGKTTAIRILCGLLRPSSGSAHVAGLDVLAEPISVKALIGVLQEEPVLYERLTGREMLWYSGRLYGLDGATIEQRSQGLFDLMGLADADADRLIVDYSMGMRKKVGLACALLHRPRVVFLDEPFNGIDALTSRAIYGALRNAVTGGMTVFFTSHVIEVAESLCSQVGIIKDGRMVACGSLDAVRSQVDAPPGRPLAEVFVDLVDPGTRERAAELVDWLS